MMLTEALDSYLEMMRGPTQALLESTPELHAAFLAAIKGDMRAFEMLYKHYWPVLVKVATGPAGSHETAEEIVNDVFTKLHTGAFANHGVTTPQGLTGLLIRSVQNAAKSQRRKDKKHKHAGIADGPDHGDAANAQHAHQFEPAAPQVAGRLGQTFGQAAQPTQNEKKIIQGALKRAFADAKLTDKERDLIKRTIGDGEHIVDTVKADGFIPKIAAELWPEMKPHSALVYANRVRRRFLKQLCGDKELGQIVAVGHKRDTASQHFRSFKGEFRAACDEEVYTIALALNIISENEQDTGTIYESLASWLVVLQGSSG